MPEPKLRSSSMDTPRMSLGNCLERVQNAEKSLLVALNEVMDTRQAILQMMGREPVPGKDASVSIIQQPALSDTTEGVLLACLDDDIESPRCQQGSATVVPAESVEEATDGKDQDQGKFKLEQQVSRISTSAEEDEMFRIAKETGAHLGISAEDVWQAYTLFHEHDKDGSGKLEVAELRVLLQKISGQEIDAKETDSILLEFDKDHDAELDFEEFLLCVCHTSDKKAAHLDAAVHQDNKLSRGFTLNMKGIPYTTLVGFLKKEVDEMTAFLSIPMIFLLFVCFLVSAHLHREVSVLRAFERSFKVDIENNANFGFSGVTPFEYGREGFKNIYDIQALEDFWSWMDTGLMPLFFPAGWSASEARSNVASYCTPPVESMKANGWDTSSVTGNMSDPAVTYFLDPKLCKLESPPFAFPDPLKSLDQFANDTRKPYRLFNEIVAGVRMKQEQLSHVDCQRPDLLGHVYVTPCIEENRQTWFRPELDTALHMDEDLVNKPGGETVYLKSATPLSEVKATMRSLENSRWLNPKTSKVQILLTTYNNHMDLFTATYVNIFINRAGDVHKVVKPICIWLDPYRYKLAYVTDICLVILVLRIFIYEVRDLVHELKKDGAKQGLKTYFHSWKNLIDWATIAYSIIVFVSWFVWCRKLKVLRDILSTANSDVVGSWPSTGDIFMPTNAEFWEIVDDMVDFYQISLTYVLAYYPFALGARFFSICDSQPRLGLVTTTLSSAAKDIFHFLIVLIVTLVIFCGSGELLFGLQVDEYENFGRTFISVVRAMLGDFDYEALTEVGRFPAVIWWLTFVVLVNLIMLNMLLVIIMDVYGHIKSGLNSDDEENFPTIWSQTYEIIERRNNVRKGTEVRITHILKELVAQEESLYHITADGNREPKLITISMFLEIVPGIRLAQAEKILELAQDWDEALRAIVSTTSVDDVLAKVRSVDFRVQRTQKMLENIEQHLESHPQNVTTRILKAEIHAKQENCPKDEGDLHMKELTQGSLADEKGARSSCLSCSGSV